MISAPIEAMCDFYGAIIHDAKLGPRHELNLRIETWREGKNTFGGGVVVNLRFGAIYNYEEVQEFFANIPADGLHYLRELSESKANRRIIEMEFDRTGARIRIIARNVSMTTS